MADKYTTRLVSDIHEIEKVNAFVKKLIRNTGCCADMEHNILLAVNEAVTNAMLHGNKNDPSKIVVIESEIKNNMLSVVITDQGTGFNPDELPDPREKENLLKTSGRGVWLMHQYADRVVYFNKGKSVKLLFNI